MKYDVGNKVKVKSDLEKTDDVSVYGVGTNDDMVKMAGKTVTINDVRADSYKIKEDDYVWTDEMFNGLAGLSKEELLDMPLGTKIITDTGKELIYDGDSFSNGEDILNILSVNDDLSLVNEDDSFGTEIVEVQTPEYNTTWKKIRKMTLKEISELVGGPIEIVEEE